jgi:hypothetical protein
VVRKISRNGIRLALRRVLSITHVATQPVLAIELLGAHPWGESRGG